MLRNNFRKIDLINNLSRELGFSSNYSKKIINELIVIIIQNIKKGDLILKNLGTFKIRKKKERVGRNPKTKEEHLISARNVVSFSPSKSIYSEINKIHE